MKVKMIADGAVAEVNDSYGARLIEQGKAVIPPKAKEKPTKAEKPVKASPPAKAAPAARPPKRKK